MLRFLQLRPCAVRAGKKPLLARYPFLLAPLLMLCLPFGAKPIVFAIKMVAYELYDRREFGSLDFSFFYSATQPD
jgi:hypothetical protein